MSQSLPPASLSAGTQLGPYEVVSAIGAGGMGEVYRARDTRLDRDVALKVSKTAFDERFERDARSVAALGHPHICALYDVGPNYLVMELVEGVPLAGPLPIEQAVEYAGQILDALDTAHKKGITHRDLKPANILVTKHGIKLLDFGLAKQTTGPLGDAQATMSALTSQGQIYRRNASGAGAADELIYSSSDEVVPVDWSRDGKRLLMVRGAGPSSRLWVVPMTGDRTPIEVFPGAPHRHDQSSFSPDGKWIAYSEIEDLDSEIYMQPYPADGRRIRISTATGINPRWTPDGRRIIYREGKAVGTDGTFYSVELQPDGKSLRPSPPVRLFSQSTRTRDRRYGADARLETFLLTTPLSETIATPVTVIVNFVQGLKR